ncbi:hypothetical protein AMTR_s00074p00075240 [Amborella trichopoda]|uniref:Uncharacterized protein n=1 Tax=Amborella trichopoda TaxID=13333 RepID=W1NMV6_AMBTC|nr:hypothetical protein AMTR_s00074p00075240 [Amborella trichopoda]
MVLSRPIFEASCQFYNPQPKPAPPMAPTYLPFLHPPRQVVTLGSNPWVSSVQVDLKYESLEGQMKIMRTSLQKMGVDDPTLIGPYDEFYLDGFADLPMNFLSPKF